MSGEEESEQADRERESVKTSMTQELRTLCGMIRFDHVLCVCVFDSARWPSRDYRSTIKLWWL